MRSGKIVLLTTTALFAAIICLTTAYLFHIPVGTAGGYIHLGDAFIYLAASFLPTPFAAVAAGVGSALADLLSGAPHWALCTLIVKALMALCFTHKKPTVLCGRNVMGAVAAGVICLAGYYFAEVILYGNWITPLMSMATGGWIQSAGALILYVLCGALLDKAHMKTRLKQFH